MGACLAAFLICLPGFRNKWELEVYEGQFYEFLITNQNNLETYGTMQGISLAQAKDIWKRNDEIDEPIPIVFYKRLEEQTLTNQNLGRSYSGTVYEMKGESCLLFPEGFPLELEDARGCLVSEGLAWQLFGDTQVTGALVYYGNLAYMVRGVLPLEDMVFVHVLTEEAALLDSLIIKADSYHTKEQYKEQLSQSYGLQLQDDPTGFQRFRITTDMLPNRMSDFSEWVNFFKNRWH